MNTSPKQEHTRPANTCRTQSVTYDQ